MKYLFFILATTASISFSQPKKFTIRVIDRRDGKLKESAFETYKQSCAPFHCLVGEVRKRFECRGFTNVALYLNGKDARANYNQKLDAVINGATTITKFPNGKRRLEDVYNIVAIIEN